MVPSRAEVITSRWGSFITMTSDIISLCPGGGWSGPLLGMSSPALGLVRGFEVLSTITSVPSTTLELYEKHFT